MTTRTTIPNGTRALPVALALVGLLTLPALAQTPNPVGTYKDWKVFSYTEGKGKVCYAAAQPKGSEPKNVNRDPAFFLITSRPADKVKNEVNVIIGYPFKEDSKVIVAVDARSFNLFTKEDGAWVETPADEAALVAAMRSGTNLTVKGTSKRGTQTTDTYSLAGITAALDAVSKNCP